MKYVEGLKTSKATNKRPQPKTMSNGKADRENTNPTSAAVNAGAAPNHRTDQLYSNVVKSAMHQTPVEDNGLNFLSNEINQLFDCGISELLNKIKAFVPIYKSQTDLMAKKLMIIDFLVQFS